MRTAAALALGWVLALGIPGAGAQPPLPLEVFYGLLNQNGAAAQASLKRIRAGWRDEYAAMLLESLGFVPSHQVQVGIVEWMARVSDRPFDGGLDNWYRWLWSKPETVHPDYAEFKAGLYEQVDPRFREYFAGRPKTLRPAAALRIAESEQAADFGERETELLRALDEAQARHGFVRVAAHAPRRARRLRHQAAPVVMVLDSARG